MSKTSQPDTADETRTDAAGEDVQLDASLEPTADERVEGAEAAQEDSLLFRTLQDNDAMGRLQAKGYTPDEILGLSDEVLAKYQRDDLTADGKIPEPAPLPGTAPFEMTAPNPTQDRDGNQPPQSVVDEANSTFEAQLAAEADRTAEDQADQAAKEAVARDQALVGHADPSSKANEDGSPAIPEHGAEPTDQ
jgi:hypothetical protein